MKLLLFAGISLFWSTAFGQTPYDFKGLRLGSPLAAVQAGTQYECGKSELPDFDDTCTLKPGTFITLAEVKAESLDLNFLSGRLGSIHVRFPSADFDAVETALRDKYGVPKKTETSIVTNRFGARFSNREILWDNGVSQVTAKRFTTNLEVSSVTLWLKSIEKEIARRSEEGRKKRAKDL